MKGFRRRGLGRIGLGHPFNHFDDFRDHGLLDGLKPEDTLHAQQAFVTRNFSAPITEAATKQAIILAKALNVTR